MERKYIKDLVDWLNDEDRKPLMVWGARQVGKSYLIEELFAKNYFKNKYLKIDLSNDIDFVEFAENNSNLSKVIEYIEIHYDFKVDENHLLFFDEAQECPSIVKMMKHFNEQRREIPVIVSGSLVRLRINHDSKKTNKKFLFPVGKINSLYIYPMTFDEFLMNYSKTKYNYIKEHFEAKKPFDSIIHEELLDLFRDYMFVGGMPEAVNTFIKNKDNKVEAFKKAEKKINEIYDDYLNDMSLYQTSTESLIRCKLIYNNIFKQLNKENKNFKISQVIENAKNRDMINSYFWLTTANVVLQSFSLKERVTLPLIQEEDSLFRFYLSDVGMFTHQSGINHKDFLIDKKNSLSGIYYENFVATELAARKFGLFYWKGKRDHELEFIINIGDRIIPIDSKKNKGALDSIEEFRLHNKNDIVIKVSANNYGYSEDNKILTIPFYCLSFYLDDIKMD